MRWLSARRAACLHRCGRPEQHPSGLSGVTSATSPDPHHPDPDSNPMRNSKPCGAEPVLDLSFLIDYVMEEVKPLHWEEVLASPIPLKIVASCLDQLRPVILEVRAPAALDPNRC